MKDLSNRTHAVCLGETQRMVMEPGSSGSFPVCQEEKELPFLPAAAMWRARGLRHDALQRKEQTWGTCGKWWTGRWLGAGAGWGQKAAKRSCGIELKTHKEGKGRQSFTRTSKQEGSAEWDPDILYSAH